MTEKELEILFRKKFDERTVEFNPAAWQGAERLIIEGEKRRRRRAIVAWSSAATAALVVGLSVWGGLNTPQYQPVNDQMIAWPTQTESAVPVIEESTQPVVEANSSDIASTSAGEVVTGGAPSQFGDAEIGSSIAAVDVNQNTTGEIVANGDNDAASQITELEGANTTTQNTPLQTELESAIFVEGLSIATIEVESPELTEPTTEFHAAPTTTSTPIIQRPRHRVQALAVGAEAGLNVSEVSNGSLGWRPAFYAGIPVEYAFAENMMLRSGLFYSQRTGHGMTETEERIDYGFGRTTFTREYKNIIAGYVELPLAFAYTIGKSELEIGGYAGLRVLELSDVQTEENATLQTANVNNYLARRSNPSSEMIDYGVRLGYAYRVDERWRITAQGTYGLMDTYDSDLTGINRHVQLRLGVRYMLGL